MDPQEQRKEAAAAAPTSGAAQRALRLATPRLKRELDTMAAMLRLYCHAHHAGAAHDADALCADCAALFDYARKRLAGCPYGPDKPTCANCQIHCYGPQQREQTRVMMRYAGPRMLWRHPLLAVMHVVDGRRPAPPKPRGGAKAAVREGSAPPADAAAPAAAENPRG